MRRMPKNRKDTEILLALAASTFDPQKVYSEKEVNEHLSEWLLGFAKPAGVDHVTVRRYLVDYYFLLRDVPGMSYRTNQAVISSVIDADARSVQPRAILDEALKERARRKRAVTK